MGENMNFYKSLNRNRKAFYILSKSEKPHFSASSDARSKAKAIASFECASLEKIIFPCISQSVLSRYSEGYGTLLPTRNIAPVFISKIFPTELSFSIACRAGSVYLLSQRSNIEPSSLNFSTRSKCPTIFTNGFSACFSSKLK